MFKTRNPLFSKASKVMSMMSTIIDNEKLSPGGADITSLAPQVADEIFHKAFDTLIKDVYGAKVPIRPLELIYTTIANKAYTK